jgi:hypothetical protein
MAVPAWLQTLRSLRPTHVVTALPRGSPLLMLSPRDLRRADSAPIPRLTLPAPFLASAALRAARDAGALLGLGRPTGESVPARAFAAAIIAAATEVGISSPFFLCTDPLAFSDGERLRDGLQRYLDAGFGEVVLDASGAPPSNLGAGLASLREREVPIAVSAPSLEACTPLLRALREAALTPDLLMLPSRPPGGAPLPVELPLDAGGEDSRGVDLSGALARMLHHLVPDVSTAALIALEAPQRDRLEAMVYAELLRVLRAGPWQGAAARVMGALAERPGY